MPNETPPPDEPGTVRRDFEFVTDVRLVAGHGEWGKVGCYELKVTKQTVRGLKLRVNPDGTLAPEAG